MRGVCFVNCDPSITLYEHTVPYTLSTLWQGWNSHSPFMGAFWEYFPVIPVNTQGDHFCAFRHRIGPHIRQCLQVEEAHNKHFSERSLPIDSFYNSQIYLKGTYTNIVQAYNLLAAFHLSLCPFTFNDLIWGVFVLQISQDCNNYFYSCQNVFWWN